LTSGLVQEERLAGSDEAQEPGPPDVGRPC
jgi:hypothetical protein